MTNKPKFEVGDRVVRIGDSWGGVEPGKTYTVQLVGTDDHLMLEGLDRSYSLALFEYEYIYNSPLYKALR